MTRPHIVRADTLDLQSRDRSAQVHSNSPNGLRNAQGLGPSQSQAIRTVSAEQAQPKHDQEKQNGASKEVDMDGVDRDLAGSDDLADEGGFDDDDDMGDRMSSSPSIADEDIDFEMVYALHTFTATVEGQANATKGEHMVLLDDSNSYWWLVRIVRDASIGYLPAEHIETPTERLARLNKHRNIDLASNMLSDSSHEKSKNPLRKAIRRRNAKTVTFSAPTYVEASEYEYSTDEEEADNGYYTNDEEEGAHNDTERNSGGVERSESGAGKSEVSEARVRSVSTTSESKGGSDPPRGDDDVKKRKNPAPASLRHPDSAVFNDDKQETRKLTLTPNLLRDDNTAAGSQVDHLRGRSSMEKIKREDGITSPQPGGKDSRKIKKGGSVLGNLFKKRSKKGRKEEEDDVDEWLHGGDKQAASISSRESQDSQMDDVAKREKEEAQKREDQRKQGQQKQLHQQRERGREAQQKSGNNGPPLTIRKVESEPETTKGVHIHGPAAQQKPAPEARQNGSASKPTTVNGPAGRKRSTSSERRASEADNGSARGDIPIALVPSRRPSKENDTSAPVLNAYLPTPQTSNSNGTGSASDKRQFQDRLSESPEHISYHDAISERPDMLDISTSSEDTSSSSPVHSSPEIIDNANTGEPSSPESHPMNRTWSDWSLRTYFEDDNDVRDMLIVVQQDKSTNAAPKREHPEIDPLFEEASTRLADITKRLDGMLGDWLQRKGRTRP